MHGKPARALLDPIDSISEVLFGLIMVLTGTMTLSVATAGRAELRTMILGALGCNLARTGSPPPHGSRPASTEPVWPCRARHHRSRARP